MVKNLRCAAGNLIKANFLERAVFRVNSGRPESRGVLVSGIGYHGSLARP